MDIIKSIFTTTPEPIKFYDAYLLTLWETDVDIEYFYQRTLQNNLFSDITFYLFEINDERLQDLIVLYGNSLTSKIYYSFSEMETPIKLISLKYFKYCFLNGLFKHEYYTLIFEDFLIRHKNLIEIISNIIYQLTIIMENKLKSKYFKFIKFSYHE